MTDELDRLKAALKAATPQPDVDARARAVALARKNFEAAQGSAAEVRPTPDRPRKAGPFEGVKDMFSRIGLRPALYATSSLAVIGLGLILVLPTGSLSPRVQIGGMPETETRTVNDDFDAQEEVAPMPEAVIAGAPESRAKRAPAPVAGLMAPAPADGYAEADKPDSERFANGDPNPLKLGVEEPVSTFSIDVDTASYAYVRGAIMGGTLPRPDAVRVEEMINYFPYAYPAPEGDLPFSTSVAVFDTPWNSGTRLVRIGIQGVQPAIEDRPALDLVFLIDTSGSMRDANKLPLLKQSFRLLLSNLRPEDRVSIVTYAGSSGLVLEPTAASDQSAILSALDRLEAGGSTAGAAGLQLAYEQAEAMAADGRIGRILLATDGDFNVGISDPEALKAFVEQKRDGGTYLSVLGFGRGNYNDALMQALAQNGNGTASYIDTLNEAQKVLVDQVSGALFPIAGDVKVQVEFNPAAIAEYRLIGYETRALAREDFSNDKVDAGDIGAGHSVTALYEVTPVDSPARRTDPLRYGATPTGGDASELGFLRLRYKTPGNDVSRLIETPIANATSTPDAEARFAAAIAGFGQLLREDKYLGDWSWTDAIALANGAKGEDAFGYRAEAVRLMRLAESLDR
jgi:Ca-activated chloride channel family protein